MRSIFIVLVVINILVFGMQLFLPLEKPMASGKNVTLHGDKLKLLKEDDKSSIASVKSKKQSDFPHNSDEDNSSMCTMVGPYAQLLQAEYLVERLGAMEASAKITTVNVSDGVGYWVYLPPEISEKEALRRLYEIQAKNIDSYIIPSGDLTNGISFGMYSEQAAARKRLEDIQASGYEVKVREVGRTHSETWVILPREEAEKIDASVWVDLLNQQQGLEKRQNVCLGVAPE